MSDEEDDDADDLAVDPSPQAWQTRYREERRRRRAATAKLTALETEVGTLRPTTERLTALERQLEAERSAWALERGALAAGITDPEGQLVARTLHSALPEAGRPPIGDWLASLAAAPDKAPRPLRPYLATEKAEEEDDAEAEEEKPVKRRAKPNAGVAAVTTAKTSAPPTGAEWAAAREKLVRGDKADWDALVRRAGFSPRTRG